MFTFDGDRRRCLAMPLGGIGTGNLAICGDGSLRQWQIHNKVNHVGFVPDSFFAIRWVKDRKTGAQALLTHEFWYDDFEAPPTSSDHYVPLPLIEMGVDLPRVQTTSCRACYPVAEISYDLGEPSLDLKMTAWNPLAPGEAGDSSWPVAIFEFRIANRGEQALSVSLMSTLQNALGWDGASPIRSVENGGYGGNRNSVRAAEGWLAVDMENVSLPSDHPANGRMTLVAMGEGLSANSQWDDLQHLWRGFEGLGRLRDSSYEAAPSRPGRTWNAATCSSIRLEPGEEKTATFLFAWHFPNRYVDWVQWEGLIPAAKSRFYLGNHYCKRGEPMQWMQSFVEKLPELRRKTWDYIGQFTATPALPEVADAMSACVGNLRTNICLWTEDGRFYGFEGGHGASTWEGFHATGGCCPMNCTHVWNYEQGLVELWPELFKTMREIDWQINLSPSGQLPHRVTLPVYVRKLWDVTIGGPENPALDGLFAAVLKTLQYARLDPEWLPTVWPQVLKAMGAVMAHADDGSGVLHGEQPNTYDIHLYGPNTFVGSQYLAALKAMAEMARSVGEDSSAYDARFETGSARYDELCFNGEYYVQRIPEGCDAPYQFGNGCASDQLLGQWWAHHLGLGYVLDPENVKSACRAIFRRNFRRGFLGFKQEPRVFASDHDAGLLVCTYEEGQRPKVPLLYSDEVWTGIEYAFAALCMQEGLQDEARAVVSAARARYDGKERNPFNEVECGDHYIRALSAWSLKKWL
jgi:non-lysosomal glucosylceramidase